MRCLFLLLQSDFITNLGMPAGPGTWLMRPFPPALLKCKIIMMCVIYAHSLRAVCRYAHTSLRAVCRYAHTSLRAVCTYTHLSEGCVQIYTPL